MQIAQSRNVQRLVFPMEAVLILGCLGRQVAAQPAPPEPVASLPETEPPVGVWRKLTTEPYSGKQDDVFFLDAKHGWYVNGAGRIYRTTDGGDHWAKILDQPGTYFRCIAFENESHGWAGNIGTDYFPGVTDPHPLYETFDSGKTWSVVDSVKGRKGKGLCALDILRDPFVDAGQLAERTIVHAAGRAGGPASLLRSVDGVSTWRTYELSESCGMILDVKFFTANPIQEDGPNSSSAD